MRKEISREGSDFPLYDISIPYWQIERYHLLNVKENREANLIVAVPILIIFKKARGDGWMGSTFRIFEVRYNMKTKASNFVQIYYNQNVYDFFNELIFKDKIKELKAIDPDVYNNIFDIFPTYEILVEDDNFFLRFGIEEECYDSDDDFYTHFLYTKIRNWDPDELIFDLGFDYKKSNMFRNCGFHFADHTAKILLKDYYVAFGSGLACFLIGSFFFKHYESIDQEIKPKVKKVLKKVEVVRKTLF